MSWIAVAIAGGAIVGGLVQGNAAQGAASTQAGASEQAAQIQENEFNTITGQEQPFMQAGYGALGQMQQGLGIGTPQKGDSLGYGSLLQPFNTSDWQQLSPAYGFQRQQGQQGTLNMDASGQGALSGAAQKDLMGFNQSLANTSFGNAFNMYQTQQGNIYQRLAGLTQLGQSAAANTGQQGTALAGNAGQAISNVGTAQAAGQVGAANAYAGALNNVTPYVMQGAQNENWYNNFDQNNVYCDYAMKDHVTPHLFNGQADLTIYEFEYKDSPGEKHLGYIAQEAQEKYPEAVSRGEKGYLRVDYSKIPGPSWEDLERESLRLESIYG